MPLVGDARVTLDELGRALAGWRAPDDYSRETTDLAAAWHAEVDRVVAPRSASLLSQHEVLGLLNRFVDPGDIVICAAGSLPGDLHRYWRARQPNTYHLEYGYSCMGYEIAGGLGVSLASPGHQAYVVVGDGSYLMMAQELVTAVQEGARLTVVLLDNKGFGSIGGLSESVGCGGFGTEYRRRSETSGLLDGDWIDVDFAANAASLGASVERATDAASLLKALDTVKSRGGVNVIAVPIDRAARTPGYDTWWDVPVAETSTLAPVNAARRKYDEAKQRIRPLI